MARGILAGVVWGTVVSAFGLGALSVITGPRAPTEPVVVPVERSERQFNAKPEAVPTDEALSARGQPAALPAVESDVSEDAGESVEEAAASPGPASGDAASEGLAEAHEVDKEPLTRVHLEGEGQSTGLKPPPSGFDTLAIDQPPDAATEAPQMDVPDAVEDVTILPETPQDAPLYAAAVPEITEIAQDTPAQEGTAPPMPKLGETPDGPQGTEGGTERVDDTVNITMVTEEPRATVAPQRPALPDTERGAEVVPKPLPKPEVMAAVTPTPKPAPEDEAATVEARADPTPDLETPPDMAPEPPAEAAPEGQPVPPTPPRLARMAGSLVDRERAGESSRLPSIGAPEEDGEAPLTDAGLLGPDSPLVKYASRFPPPAGVPRMAVILIDDGSAPMGPVELETLPFPVSFAIAPGHPKASEVAEGYRERGFEVLALADMPEGAQASDVEVALSGLMGLVPGAVGVLEGTGTGLQGSRAVASQAAAYLGASGHGLVMEPKGLNTAQKLASKAGVPAVTLFRDFDGAGQDENLIRRTLDQAAFRAKQEGEVVMLGRLKAGTLSALMLWGLQDRGNNIALVPISVVLKEAVEPALE
ncbi:divergent polysaccharide deacetylase family protein [Sagittula salina]|uniref:Divergent polysaccharide deacetylase family protein n=1 Tax=Sagittula salina TaxID=2820268 RepID=A0A940MLC1_9RHOB|nr:divergent polysaccharide deacetylase family protein [Sagittula salina]MBP0481875.1 divergent polysaccharide deacetylase family protein [Sagittula salina]